MVPCVAGPIHRYMTSAPGCWAKHGELSAFLLSTPSAASYRRLCADAYAVQHPGQPGPQATQSVGGHLVDLFGLLELGVSLDRMSVVLERGIARKGFFTWLTPPSFDGARTILFMLDQLADPERAAHEWATSAWRAWAAHHAQVRAWYESLSKMTGGRGV